jgi:hypothetical protein
MSSHDDPRCARCGCGLYGAAADGEYCEACLADRPPWEYPDECPIPDPPGDEAGQDEPGWCISRKGNPWCTYLGLTLTVFPGRRLLDQSLRKAGCTVHGRRRNGPAVWLTAGGRLLGEADAALLPPSTRPSERGPGMQTISRMGRRKPLLRGASHFCAGGRAHRGGHDQADGWS